MSDRITLMIGKDGTAKLYDDTYDIVIHCETEEEQKAAMEKLKGLSDQQAGRWKELHSDRGPLWECPNCGYRVNPEDGGIYHYCSACGKKLEEDDG